VDIFILNVKNNGGKNEWWENAHETVVMDE